ncbi:hypothetical protein Tsubulata_024599 [Turnera subulata]|uniref:Survival Motor Neuron Gemin2-binding domain-containing protein n=1 Tax=Turnera subulata TaxID=218843 RepID=A0A9Q0JMI2_9ROSI|nr:hypothetical protein Tsubulata_024599 [Turnera subulata]
MGKEGELWDDSALINAFDNAMSKYKKMHGKKVQSKSVDEGRVAVGNGGEASGVIDEAHGTIREADEETNAASSIPSEVKVAEKHEPVKGNTYVESSELGPSIDTSNGPPLQTVNGSSYSQNAEDYNRLLGEYYELEEKRQIILQQLQQFGGYYQYPAEASGIQWGSSGAPQDYSVPATQTSLPPAENYSCCSCACYCPLPPCPSCSACSLSRTYINKPFTDSSAAAGPGHSFIHGDEDIVKTAMGAAERAISSLSKKASAASGLEGEKSEDTSGEMTQCTSSETDFGVVLNAWYTAGFHTGKYLTEQSIAKKRNG